jgi:hypothetical protein
LPDNTLRWINLEDVDDRFHLHHVSAYIIGARLSRDVCERERDHGSPVVFVAPDLAQMRARQSERRNNALTIVQVLERAAEQEERETLLVAETTPLLLEKKKKRRAQQIVSV